MSWRTLGITSIALLLLSLRQGTAFIFLLSPPTPHMLHSFPHRDAESLFAAGQKLSLACATVSDLELISGVSDTIARSLLESVMHTPSSSKTISFREQLLSVKGIGPKLAATLLEFLSPALPCPAGSGTPQGDWAGRQLSMPHRQ